MGFTQGLPTWTKVGTAPSGTKQAAGWLVGERPPADWLNWHWNLTYLSLNELQQNSVHKDGTVAFTGSPTFGIAQGTRPFSVTSTTVVTNLNADLHDGLHTATAATVNTVAARDASGDLTARRFVSGLATGTSPFSVTSTTVNTNLNADLVDGFHAQIANGNSTVAVRGTGGDLAATTFTSSAAAGTAPFTVASTTKVTNLNADQVDGYHLNQDVQTTASPTFVRATFSQAAGTAPFTVTSDTLVANLNADKLDGYQASNTTGAIPISNGTVNVDLNADKLDGYHAGNATGQIPISNGTLNTNLNAQMVGGVQLSGLMQTSHAANAVTGFGTTTSALAAAAAAGTSTLVSRSDHVHALPAVATQSVSGLMSSGDKAKLDGLLSSQSATLPATLGWYRVAQSASGIGRNAGRFEIDWTHANAGSKGQVVFNAGISNGVDPTINQIMFVSESMSKGLTKARIVYHTTASGNYAYVEVYSTAAEALALNVQLLSTLGWSLIAPISGSIPAGYTSQELDFINGISTEGQLKTNVATGTSPFVVSSTTVVTNLNADKVDGYDFNQDLRTTSNVTFNNLTVSGTAGSALFKGGASDHVFIGLYARAADQVTRSGFIGYGSAGTANLEISNGLTGGHVVLTPGAGGQVQTNGLFQAGTLKSTVATGTSPLTVTSTTTVTNLSADMVDGYHLNQDVRTTGTPTFAQLTVQSGTFTMNTPYAAGNGSWARGHRFYSENGITELGGIGITGSADVVSSMYMAHGVSPWSNGNGVYVLPSGFVGIKRTGPTAELDVNGVAKANSFTSTVATGTAPLTVTSTTVVTNFNADMLDGLHSNTGATVNTIAARDASGNLRAAQFQSTVATGTAPLTVNSTTLVTNLNADKVDGYDFNQDLRTTASPSFKELTILPGLNLGGTSGDSLTLSNFVVPATVNSVTLQVRGYRTANGADWQTAAVRLQRRTDSIYQQFIEFHPDGNINADISYSGQGPTGFQIFGVSDSMVKAVPRAAAGNYNPLVGYGDAVLIGGTGGPNVANVFTISPWSDTTSGIRLVGNGAVWTRYNTLDDGAGRITASGITSNFANISMFCTAPGEARYHLFNNGLTAEWLFGQINGTEHDFTISKRIGGNEEHFARIFTSGNTNFGGRTIVHSGANAGIGGQPTISLAIGDHDTGLNWGGDGAVQLYTNNIYAGYWNQSEFRWNYNHSIGGTKSAYVQTQSYDEQLLYALEAPEVRFEDMGRAQTDETGRAEIFFEDIFKETVDLTDADYLVHVTGIDGAGFYVPEQYEDRFVIEGPANKRFVWRVTAWRYGYKDMRFNWASI